MFAINSGERPCRNLTQTNEFHDQGSKCRTIYIRDLPIGGGRIVDSKGLRAQERALAPSASGWKRRPACGLFAEEIIVSRRAEGFAFATSADVLPGTRSEGRHCASSRNHLGIQTHHGIYFQNRSRDAVQLGSIGRPEGSRHQCACYPEH